MGLTWSANMQDNTRVICKQNLSQQKMSKLSTFSRKYSIQHYVYVSVHNDTMKFQEEI